jgi:RHS repeat-associated protein
LTGWITIAPTEEDLLMGAIEAPIVHRHRFNCYGVTLNGYHSSNGRWIYTWNAENRLIRMESYSGAPLASRRRVQMDYDFQGRRIQRIVSTHNGTSWVVQSTLRYLYDGWNLIAELNAANAVQRTFIWGTDLSGTMQGAGGVGGLLMVRQVVTPAMTHYVAYDGNGNVSGLVNASTGDYSAQYEYDPFGQTIRITGTMAKSNPFRFSTKYTDDATDMVYYGYRYYNPSTGRWLSRDPIEESAGPAIYVFVLNSPILWFDVHGLEAFTEAYFWGTRTFPSPKNPHVPRPPEHSDNYKPDHGGIANSVNNTSWFERKYQGWVAAAKIAAIDAGDMVAKTACRDPSIPKTLYVGYSQIVTPRRYGFLGFPGIGGRYNEQQYGDGIQSLFQSRAVLGRFRFSMDQIKMEWGCCTYRWSGTLRVMDTPGSTGGDFPFGIHGALDLAGYQVNGPEIERAKWPLRGVGNCCR